MDIYRLKTIAMDIASKLGKKLSLLLYMASLFLKSEAKYFRKRAVVRLAPVFEYVLKELNVFGLFLLRELRIFGVFLLKELRLLGIFLLGQLRVFGKFVFRHRKPVGFGVATVCISVFALFALVESLTVYEYSIQGHLLGTVSDRNTVLKSVERFADEWVDDDGLKVAIDKEEDIEFTKITRAVNAAEVKLDAEEEVIAHLSETAETAELKVLAYEITVDGKSVGILSDRESADKVLGKVQTFLVGTKDMSKFKSVNYVEDVQVKEIKTDKESVKSGDDIYNYILKGVLEVKTYVVKNGDSLYDIAISNDVSQDDLEAWNPNIHSIVIHEGDEIKLQEEKSIINIKTVETQAYTADLDFETIYEDTAALWEGEEEVVVPGVKGVREVVGDVVYINGKESERIELSSKTTEESSPQTVRRGTRPLPPRIGTGTYVYPVSGRYSSGFGYRWGRLHAGIDFACRTGSNVVASDGGVVLSAGWTKGYGYMVVINHGQGMSTAYAHNSKLLVSAGERVAQGQSIALSGNTGNSTGPHVHFEVRKFGVAEDPANYL
jgi:murein DD-endopeptidase MepM/ murein hydrolase activator NlpD